MKELLIVGLLTISFTSNASTFETKIEDSISRIDREISKEANNLQNEVSSSASLSEIDNRESVLLKSLINGYDHLKKYSLTDRYVFIYEGVKAASLSHPERIQALKEWLNKQTTALQAKKIHPRFYEELSPVIASIDSAINELGIEKPVVESTVSPQNYISTLSELKSDLEKIKELRPETETQTVFVEKHADAGDTVLYKGLLAGAVALLALSLLRPRKKKVVYIKQQVKETPIAHPVVEEKEEVNLPKSHLETECRNLFEKNSYLLDLAEIKVQNPTRIPFDTSIEANPENVKEALNWLLKGALAITNTSKDKASSIEWNCTENDGRINLNFIIHGIECDYDTLYMNTMLEGDSSAVSHFSRSEQTLENHLPSMLFKKGNKKTILSYGLESSTSVITH